MPPILQSDDGRHVVIRPLAYVREYELKNGQNPKLPIDRKGLCGAGENKKRTELKALIRQWDRECPGRVYNIFMSMKRVSPSHLMDSGIYDFGTFTRRSVVARQTSDEVQKASAP